MIDVNGIARSENGENVGITEASGLCGVVVDLGSWTKIISAGFPCNQTRGSP